VGFHIRAELAFIRPDVDVQATPLFAKSPGQEIGHDFAPGFLIVPATHNLNVAYIVITAVAFFDQLINQISCIVDGIDDAVVVTVAGFIVGYGFKTEF
jgi:hypothetical protein